MYEHELTDGDKTLLSEFDSLTRDVTTDIEEFRVYMAAEKLYHYAWHELADKIIEESKPLIKTGGGPVQSRRETLVHLFANTLVLLHPFMPFITEEIWQSMPPPPGKNERGLLIVAPWPVVE